MLQKNIIEVYDVLVIGIQGIIYEGEGMLRENNEKVNINWKTLKRFWIKKLENIFEEKAP